MTKWKQALAGLALAGFLAGCGDSGAKVEPGKVPADLPPPKVATSGGGGAPAKAAAKTPSAAAE